MIAGQAGCRWLFFVRLTRIGGPNAQNIRCARWRTHESSLSERFAQYPAAVRATGLFHDKRTKFSSYGRCRECRYLETCGFCPVSIGHQPNNDDPDRVPDFLCAFNLVSNKYRERFPKLSPVLLNRSEIGNGKCSRFPVTGRIDMANERMNDPECTTPSVEVEKDTQTEQTKRDRPTENIKNTEDVKVDEAMDDRFQATDN